MGESNPLVEILEFYKSLGVTHLNLNPPERESVEVGIKDCTRCNLSGGRSGFLTGWGSSRAELLLVADALTEDALREGTPVSGEAWELLLKIISAIDIRPEDTFITNAVKCTAGQAAKPAVNEIEACRPWLLSQIELIAPRVVVALGTTAAQALLATDQGISSLRGRFYFLDKFPVMPTFHPEYLLHNPRSKAEVWHDMKLVRARLTQGR